MSKIRQGRFKSNLKEINVGEKLENIFEFFKDDMKFREIDFEVKKSQVLQERMVKLDDARFIIVLYNLVSNSVKHTNGGSIKVSVKLLSDQMAKLKSEKFAEKKKMLQLRRKSEWGGEQEQDEEESEEYDSEASQKSF